jgi:predicted acylesterase/phospholipase RssA
MMDIDLVISGAGSNGVMEAGAIDAIKGRFRVARAGGASAGAINAVALCAEISDVADLWKEFLTRGDLEDWKTWPIRPLGVLSGGFGMIKGNKIRAALESILGKKELGELKRPCRLVVGNLAERKIEVIDSENPAHAELKCVDVLRCSLAVPFLIDAAQIDPKKRTLYTDGGTGANAPAGLFDDQPQRATIVIRFKSDEKPRPVKSLREMIAAIFDIRQDAANNAMQSVKSKLMILELPNAGNSMDFSLDKQEVMRLYELGLRHGSAWADRQ